MVWQNSEETLKRIKLDAVTYSKRDGLEQFKVVTESASSKSIKKIKTEYRSTAANQVKNAISSAALKNALHKTNSFAVPQSRNSNRTSFYLNHSTKHPTAEVKFTQKLQRIEQLKNLKQEQSHLEHNATTSKTNGNSNNPAIFKILR